MQIKTKFEATQYAVKKRQEDPPVKYKDLEKQIYDLGFKRANGNKWMSADICRWVINAEPSLRSYEKQSKHKSKPVVQVETPKTKVDDTLAVIQIIMASSIKNKAGAIMAVLQEV